MKSIPVLRPVINCCRFCFVAVFLINIHTSCQAQTKDTLYILFERDNPNMLIMSEKENWHYAFFFSKYYYWGFEPKGKVSFIRNSEFKNEVVNFTWLNQKHKFQSQLILKHQNIFIIEKVNRDSLKIIPVRAFEAIE